MEQVEEFGLTSDHRGPPAQRRKEGGVPARRKSAGTGGRAPETVRL